MSQHRPSAQFVQSEKGLLLERQMHVVLVHVSYFDMGSVFQICQRRRVACVCFLSMLAVHGAGCVSFVVHQDAESVNRMLVGVGDLCRGVREKEICFIARED